MIEFSTSAPSRTTLRTDRRVGPDVGVAQLGARADHGWAAHDARLEPRRGVDDHPTLDVRVPELRVTEVRLQPLQRESIGLQQHLRSGR